LINSSLDHFRRLRFEDKLHRLILRANIDGVLSKAINVLRISDLKQVGSSQHY